MSSVTSKLRDSCNACATSKIKCPKERPSCSRCEIRGVKCHYSFTKRPGRKPENGASRRPSGDIITVGDNIPKNVDSSTDSDRDGSHSAPGDKQNPRRARQPSVGALFWAQSPTSSAALPGDTPATVNTSSVSEYFALTSATGSTAVGSSPRGNTPGPADTSDIFSMLGDINAFPDFDGFDPKLDKLLESDIDSVFAMPLPDPTIKIPHPDSDIITLLMPNNCNEFDIALADAPPVGETGALNASSVASTLSSSLLSWSAPVLSTSSTLSSSSSSPSSKPSHPIIIGESPASGSLARTLDILKSLSSLQSSRTSSYSDLSTISDADTFARVVLEENQKSINAVSSILSSSACGEDSFLLVVLSMIVLKILERCDAVAHIQHEDETRTGWSSQLKNSAISRNMNQTHHRSLSGPSTGASRHNADSRETSVAKLVLGELHRVQRLVNELSKEIKKHREGDDGDQIMRDVEKGPRALVTANTLAQLETDMRKSLRALSSEIIDRLRHR